MLTSVSAETYIVISLMFAVFAAVAAVGTSIVLGAGFERLRAGFEIIRRQSGFFADAIYKLDQRTNELGKESSGIKEAMANLDVKVERVDKQTAFFSDAIHSLEEQILHGSAGPDPHSLPAQAAEETLLPQKLDWLPDDLEDIQTPHTDNMLRTLVLMGATPASEQQNAPEPLPEVPPLRASRPGLSSLLTGYFRAEDREQSKGVVYH